MVHLSAHPTAVNSENLTRDIPASSTRKVYRTSFKVLRIAPTACWYPFQDACRSLLIIDQCSVHLCSNVARSNSVHADPLGCPLVGQGFGELTDSTFACGVCRDIDAALEGQERSDIDDAASSSMLVWRPSEHVCSHVSAKSEHCVQVHLHHLVPVVVRELVSRMSSLDAATVQQDVNLVSIFEHFRQ